MNKENRIGLVIVAGGHGQRMGADCPKQFLKLDGKEIILHTLDVFNGMDLFCETVVVCHSDYTGWCRKIIDEALPGNKIKIVSGGQTRQESVYSGLKAIGSCEYVLIHDAVRCCVDECDIKKLCDFVTDSGACALGVRVKDTVKVADSSGYILSTPDRNYLWQIQTPQAFEYREVCKAHQKALAEQIEATDDCALMELYGGKVRIIEGSYENIKITTPSDMDIAGLYIKKKAMK